MLKFFQFHSIRSRMMSGFLFLTMLIIVLAIASVYILDRTQRITGIHAQINQLQVYTLNLIKTDNDFFDIGTAHESYFVSHQSPFLSRRDSLIFHIERLFQDVKANMQTENYEVQDNLVEIDSIFKVYNTHFSTLENLLFLKGFRDFGLEGRMRDHAHALEDSHLGLPMVTVLTLRRHEKDFLLRHDLKYVDDFNQVANLSQAQLSRDSLLYQKGIQELRSYQGLFNQLATINCQIGLNSLSGLRNDLNTLTQQLSTRYLTLADESFALSTQAVLNIRVFYVGMMIGAVFFTIFSGLWISKRLSAPIARLSKLIQKVMRQKRKKAVSLQLNHAATEIRLLAESFNKLMDQANTQMQEIRQKSKLLKKKNYDLKKLNHELDSFLYSTAHDLRSPLSSLLGLLQLAERENKQPELTSYFTMMKSSINRQEDFIQQIVSYSKNSKMNLQIEKFSLEGLIKDILESHRFMEGAERVTAWIDIKEEIPFLSDKSRMSILFNNLISNAIRYADPAKERSWIRITAHTTPEDVFIEFADNGIGIESDHLHRIFDMFYRANLSSKGSGLGLFIFRETIQKLKGLVSVESTIKVGSKFTLRIPNHFPTHGDAQLNLESLTISKVG
jgi:signal transduction histidine kinase